MSSENKSKNLRTFVTYNVNIPLITPDDTRKVIVSQPSLQDPWAWSLPIRDENRELTTLAHLSNLNFHVAWSMYRPAQL
jgi:hypothetical protein